MWMLTAMDIIVKASFTSSSPIHNGTEGSAATTSSMAFCPVIAQTWWSTATTPSGAPRQRTARSTLRWSWPKALQDTGTCQSQLGFNWAILLMACNQTRIF